MLIQVNLKPLEQLKSGFKETINWNKREPKVTVEQQNQYLDFLINPSFQGVNSTFVLSFEDTNRRTSYKRYYLPLVETKDYNFAIAGQKLLITYDEIRKIATVQGDVYMTGWLLDYNYFNNYYKMMAIDFNKQQALDFNPKAIQQSNFTANLDWAGITTILLIIEEAKETILDSWQATVKVL